MSQTVKTGSGKIFSEKNGGGTSGILCRTVGGKYFVRVYHGDDVFDD